MNKSVTTEGTGIISFSIESLGNMKMFRDPGDLYYEGCVFAYRNMTFNDQLVLFRYPCRIDAFVAILCIRGSAVVISNLRRFTIKENTLFINMPNDIIQLESWNECEFCVIALEEDFTKRMKIENKKIFSVYRGMQKNPCITMTQEETDNLMKNYRSMSEDLVFYRGTEFYDDIIVSYISLAALKVSSIISSHHWPVSEITKNFYQSAESHFDTFLSLLSGHFKEERHIGFYASRMCITPKYLTTLVKKTSGKSATEWINDYVILEAKHLLKFSQMSIQEISYYLSFPNASFFTQYFRRQTGMTPGKYRIQP